LSLIRIGCEVVRRRIRTVINPNQPIPAERVLSFNPESTARGRGWKGGKNGCQRAGTTWAEEKIRFFPDRFDMFIMFLQPKCEFSEDFCAGSVPKWSRWWQAGRSSEVGSARESIFGLHIYIYIGLYNTNYI
jgi:hypothetical protein